MSRILSIEVGSSFTRICETDFRSKSPKVYKSLTIPNPENLVDDGFINENPDFVSALKFALADSKIRTKQAVFSVTSSRIVTREAVLPVMKEAQLDAMIRTNISDYIPVDPNNFEIAHMVLGTVTDTDGTTKNRVLILTADKKLVENYRTFAEACGLKMNCLDYSGNSVFQIMRNVCKEETELVVKVEERSTVCTIINDKNLMMQRNIPYGIDSAVQAVINSTYYSENTYEDALELLKGKTVLRNVMYERTRVLEAEDSPEDTEKVRMARTEITGALDVLIGNISRVVDLYNNKNPEKMIRHASIIGLGSDISGLSKLFTNELGIRTSFVNTVAGLNFTKMSGEKGYGQYVATVGAAMAPVGFLSLERRKNDMMNVNYRTASILCAVLFGLICGYMLFSARMNLKTEEDIRAELKRKEITYSEGERVLNRLENVKSLYTEVLTGYLTTASPNDNLLTFLEEMEQKLPSDIVIGEFTSDTELVSMKIICPELEEAGYVIDTIRHFDSLMTVSVSTITREEIEDENAAEQMEGKGAGAGTAGSESGETDDTDPDALYNYSFTINGVYYPVIASPAETETE